MKKLFLLCAIVCCLSVSVFAQTDIRNIDFKNFTYQPNYCGNPEADEENPDAEVRNITVKDGEFSEEIKEGEGEDEFINRLFFGIFHIAYGDLDGDKKEEAIILSSCNTGGTGNFSELYIYKMVKGKPTRVMLLIGGDRADGGLHDARVEKGLLIVESNGVGELGGACCPEEIITNTYKFDGKELKEIGQAKKRELYPATRISFDKGKTSKTVAVKMSAKENLKRFVVGAAKGQILVATVSDPNARVSMRKGEAEIIEEDTKLTATLNETGDFVLETFSYFDGDTNFNLTISITNAGTPTVEGSINSIYTDLAAEKCKTIEANEEDAGWYVGECAGVGDFKLEVTEGDLRQSINVLNKSNGEKWELDLISKVSNGFSALGEKAEWRVKTVKGKQTPVALIVRYNVSEDPEDSTIITSYLIVSRINSESTCITNIVKPMNNQNEKARQFADNASGTPCVE